MNAIKEAPPTGNKVSSKFLQEAQALAQANAQATAGQLTALAFSRMRELHMANALLELAAGYGVSLELPLQIDSRGEFRIVSLSKDGSSSKYGAAPFGDFAAVLNQYKPRTGIGQESGLFPGNGWCYLNHWEAEKMILAHAAAPSRQNIVKD